MTSCQIIDNEGIIYNVDNTYVINNTLNPNNTFSLLDEEYTKENKARNELFDALNFEKLRIRQLFEAEDNSSIFLLYYIVSKEINKYIIELADNEQFSINNLQLVEYDCLNDYININNNRLPRYKILLTDYITYNHKIIHRENSDNYGKEYDQDYSLFLEGSEERLGDIIISWDKSGVNRILFIEKSLKPKNSHNGQTDILLP